MTEKQLHTRKIVPDAVDQEWVNGQAQEKAKTKTQTALFGIAAVHIEDLIKKSGFSYKTEVNGQVVDLAIFLQPMLYAAHDKSGEKMRLGGERDELQRIRTAISQENKRVNGKLPEIGNDFGMSKGNNDPITGNPLPNSESDGDDDNWGSDF